METNLNGGLTVSEVASNILDLRHADYVYECGITNDGKTPEEAKKELNERKYKARRTIEEHNIAKSLLDEFDTLGNGVNMHESPKTKGRNTTGKGGFHKPGNGICLDLPGVIV